MSDLELQIQREAMPHCLTKTEYGKIVSVRVFPNYWAAREVRDKEYEHESRNFQIERHQYAFKEFGSHTTQFGFFGPKNIRIKGEIKRLVSHD